MKRYTLKEKEKAVLLVLKEGKSAHYAASELGTVHAVVQRWIARYKEYGIEGLHSKKPNYSGKFKLDVIEYMQSNHLSLFETAVKFGIPHETTIYRWLEIYNKKGESGFDINQKLESIMKSSNNNEHEKQIQELKCLLKRLMKNH